jgi:hypothetical protein
MTTLNLLLVVSLVALQTAAQAPSATTPGAGDAKVAASIKDAVASARLTKIEGGDYKFDRAIVVPPTVGKPGAAPDTEVLYQIGVSSKDNSNIFLPVRMSPIDSAATAKRLDQALAQLNMSMPEGQILACVGERTCSKVCKNDGSEYCCKWTCDKTKQ